MYFSFRIHCISTVYKAHIVSQKLQLMHGDRVGTVQKVRGMGYYRGNIPATAL